MADDDDVSTSRTQGGSPPGGRWGVFVRWPMQAIEERAVLVPRYPQSCLVVEVGGRRLLIDPGVFVTAEYEPDDLGEVHAVLYTHRHPDHVDTDLAGTLHGRGIELFGNADVCELLGAGRVTEVRDGEPFYDLFTADPRHFAAVCATPADPGPDSSRAHAAGTAR
jgi:glyoxylase-like metal-dependent hydrolase (beta-lactamase superfamily II)